MSAQETPRYTLIKEIQLLLGDQESHVFFTMQPDQNVYTLPNEVQEVEKLYRRGVGANSTGGTNFDPFEAAFSNIYLLQAGRTGGLATWDFFAQYQETIGRVFGSEINFIWRPSTHQLELIRRPTAEEDVMAKVWMVKPEVPRRTSWPWRFSIAEWRADESRRGRRP